MSVTIKTIREKESYSVNNKEVYKDSNGNRITREELTAQETKCFNQYRAVLDQNPKQEWNCEEHNLAE